MLAGKVPVDEDEAEGIGIIESQVGQVRKAGRIVSTPRKRNLRDWPDIGVLPLLPASRRESELDEAVHCGATETQEPGRSTEVSPLELPDVMVGFSANFNHIVVTPTPLHRRLPLAVSTRIPFLPTPAQALCRLSVQCGRRGERERNPARCSSASAGSG